MGAAASVDLKTAKQLAGDMFDQSKWDAAEKEEAGTVSLEVWNAWAAEAGVLASKDPVAAPAELSADAAKMDTNADGLIDAKELAAAKGMTERAAENVIRNLADADGDGKLDATEAAVLAGKGALEVGVASMDNDGDGLIAADELAEATGMSTRDAEAAVKLADANGDSKLSLEEMAADVQDAPKPNGPPPGQPKAH
jgi:Ca2+-binding EF-hand superfamily protein